MTVYTQVQQAIAELRTQIAPELKRRVGWFALISIAIALLALIVLTLIGAIYQPLAWAVLVLTGAAYGWYARDELTIPRPSELIVLYPPFEQDEAEDD